jgi:hypothetical protein
MVTIVDALSIWEIGFRWAGQDPSRLWPRLPLLVRDNFRTLIQAIFESEIDCITLSMRKWTPDDGEDMKPYFIRHYMGEIEACVIGKSFDRKFLKWAVINRYAFYKWCKDQGIPLPEFWFPPGWKIEYESAEFDSAEQDASGSARSRVACQEIAKVIWKERPDSTIAALVKDPLVRKYGGGAHFDDETVRRWLSKVAPEEVKAKRGRPRKKPPAQAD